MAGFNLMGRVRSLGKRVFGINDISDVDTTGLDDGEVLVYSSSSGKFEPGSVSMTGAEIKTAYEAEANTNAYTDAEKTKLAGIAEGAEVNTVDSVNGATGAVVLDIDDFGVDGSTTGSDPNGRELPATATIALLAPGGIAENEYTFAMPSSGVAGGHHITLVNTCGAAATIKGVTGGDITLADDRSITLAFAGGAWYRPDYSA